MAPVYIAQTSDGEHQRMFDNRTDAMREVHFLAAHHGSAELVRAAKNGRLYVDTRCTQEFFKAPR